MSAPVNSMATLAQIAPWLHGATLVGDTATAFVRVHTDTRTLAAGDLFVALRGERYDAHDFLPQALSCGAVAAIVSTGLGAGLDDTAAALPGLRVPDTRAALGQLGAAWRAQFTLPLIAVTGSNGKTTVTQMIAAMLRAHAGDAALWTQGNFNNDIGVPLTLLRLRSTHRVAVVELGMNHPGEIALLAAMAAPTVALVNNAQREHQEFMQSVEAVAHENGAVIAALPASGVAVVPAASEFTALWRGLAGTRRVLSFGMDEGDVAVRSAQWSDGAWHTTLATPSGEITFALHIAGRHNLLNAAAAVACALAAGLAPEAVRRGLEAFEAVKGRSRAIAVPMPSQGRSLTLVDDSYNANPDSVRAAIDVLAELPGPHLLVLGDMGEVGNQGPQFHAEVGDYARERGIKIFFTLGEQAAAMRGHHFSDIDSLCAEVLTRLPHLGSMLVKGSRFMKMERVVEAVLRAVDSDAPVASTAAARKHEAHHAA